MNSSTPFIYEALVQLEAPAPEGWGDQYPAQQLTSDPTLMSSQVGTEGTHPGIGNIWVLSVEFSLLSLHLCLQVPTYLCEVSYELWAVPFVSLPIHPHISPVAGASSSKWLSSFPVLGPFHFSCPGFGKCSRPDEGELKDDLSTLLKHLQDFHFLSIRSRLFSEDTLVPTTLLTSKTNRQNLIILLELGLCGKGNPAGKK